MKTKRVIFFILVIILCMLPLGSIQAKVDSGMENLKFPVEEYIWNECTNEHVHLTGTMHVINHWVNTPSGGLHWKFLHKYQNVSGIGKSSGIKYVKKIYNKFIGIFN